MAVNLTSLFDEYVKHQSDLQTLKYTIDDCDEKLQLIHDATAVNILETPERTKEIENIYKPRINTFKILRRLRSI